VQREINPQLTSSIKHLQGVPISNVLAATVLAIVPGNVLNEPAAGLKSHEINIMKIKATLAAYGTVREQFHSHLPRLEGLLASDNDMAITVYVVPYLNEKGELRYRYLGESVISGAFIRAATEAGSKMTAVISWDASHLNHKATRGVIYNACVFMHVNGTSESQIGQNGRYSAFRILGLHWQ